MINEAPEMDPIRLGYSFKNIPLSSKKQYMAKMFEMTGRLVERMRWKVNFFDENANEGNQQERRKFDEVFKTSKSAPVIKELEQFENELYGMVTNIKFRKYSNSLMEKMREDLEQIESSDCVFVFADKTLNMYKMKTEQYNKLLIENVTSKYEKAADNMIEKMDREARC